MASARQAAGRLWEADSIATLFGTMSTDRLTPAELIEIGTAQADAIDAWLAAYVEFKTGYPAAAARSSRPGLAR